VAGNLFAYFHYVLGLSRLGHDVIYLEANGWPNACYDPDSRQWTIDPRPGMRRVHSLLQKSQLDVPVWYVDRDSGHCYGTEWDDVKRTLRSADLLLNVGGVCWLPEFRHCGCRALIDMDPLFTQVGRFGAWLLDDHHVHFSYGTNIGRPECSVPTQGVDWLPTVPPVVLDVWDGPVLPASGKFTTIANWSAYGAVTYQNERFGQKDEEFLRLIDLPQLTTQPLELVLAGVPDSVKRGLHQAGWSVRSAGEPLGIEVPAYQSYIRGSRGELSAAKHAYVKTRSGWFSDRSVCYLAAGKPVVLQDTGFSDWLPEGRGVLAFSSVDEAADRLERVNAEYEVQSRAARETARLVFAHDVVLSRLLNNTLSSAAA